MFIGARFRAACVAPILVLRDLPEGRPNAELDKMPGPYRRDVTIGGDVLPNFKTQGSAFLQPDWNTCFFT
jgi:hypothetical protein